MEKKRSGLGSFADLFIYTVVVGIKWDGLLRHRVYNQKVLKIVAPQARIYSNLLITTPGEAYPHQTLKIGALWA